MTNVIMEMDQKRNSKNIVKVAIELGSSTFLFILDQDESLENIIKNVCAEQKVENNYSKYAFQLKEQGIGHELENKYITEENRHRVQNGCILKVVFSASEMVNIILSKCDGDEQFWAFDKLSALTKDPVVAKSLVDANGVDKLLSVLDNIKDGKIIGNCLSSLYYILKYNFINDIDAKFIHRLTHTICKHEEEENWEVVEYSLAICRKIIKLQIDMPASFPNVQINLTSTDLLHHLKNSNKPKIQEIALRLINTLAIASKNSSAVKCMSSAKLKNIIHRFVLISKSDMSNGIMKQLYVYQSLIFGLLEESLKSNADVLGGEASSIKEINDTVLSTNNPREKLYMSHAEKNQLLISSSINDTDYKFEETEKLKHKSGSNVAAIRKRNSKRKQVDFAKVLKITNDLSKLTIYSMLFFKRTYPESFTQVLLTEGKNGHLFYNTCDSVLKLLGRILGIGEMKVTEKRYQPLVFSVAENLQFIGELFSRALLRLTKTRREMRAKTMEDNQKVLKVLERQITEGLKLQPSEWRELDKVLQEWSYDRVSQVWQDEHEQELQWNLQNLPAVIQLRDNFTEELMHDISNQRINILCKGQQFPKINTRHQKSKSKFWYIFLSSNLKMLHYGDISDDNKEPDCPFQVAVSSIVDLVTGKRSPHVQNMKSSKIEPSHAFSLILDTENQKSLDFIAPTDEVFDHWTDGFHVLLGKNMMSRTMKQDLKCLLDMEVRLQLMELDGVPIPISPPPLPDDPPNYDFIGIRSTRSSCISQN